MQQVFRDVFSVLRQLNVLHLLTTALFCSLLVWFNYSFQLEQQISSLPSNGARFLGFFPLLVISFLFPYLFIFVFADRNLCNRKSLFWSIILATALFSAKMAFRWQATPAIEVLGFPDGRFWTLVLHWPAKALFLWAAIWLIWKLSGNSSPVAGMNKLPEPRNYLPLLLLIFPVLFAVAGMDSFQVAYPKYRNAAFIADYVNFPWFYYLIYEISYGIDFFSIELFFRGFLVLGFLRFAGPQAIVPAAAFYCAIHFGKPVLECISSFFGGLLLGALVYKTRSIWGGLILHLGIAWMMEILASVRA